MNKRYAIRCNVIIKREFRNIFDIFRNDLIMDRLSGNFIMRQYAKHSNPIFPVKCLDTNSTIDSIIPDAWGTSKPFDRYDPDTGMWFFQVSIKDHFDYIDIERFFNNFLSKIIEESYLIETYCAQDEYTKAWTFENNEIRMHNPQFVRCN